MTKSNILRRILLILALIVGLSACSAGTKTKESQQPPTEETVQKEKKTAENAEGAGVVKGTAYYDRDSVAEYIHKYKELPPNYLTKKEASEKGWESAAGNLWDVTDKGVIGGDRFGNREKLLPNLPGISYRECDVNYNGGRRGPERLVYSGDGWIYYTGDHYASFEVLYEGEAR